MSLKVLEPAGAAANRSAAKISPAGNTAGLLAAAAPHGGCALRITLSFA
jgi:hypothetical protein